MSDPVPFACRCGEVRGRVENPARGGALRVKCHCRDCQSFAHYCGAADHVLDSQQGTDLYLARCVTFVIEQGRDALACVHLTDKATLRWYCGACRTPMFNTFENGKWPYLSVFVAGCEAGARDRLGPVAGHLFVEDGSGGEGLKRISMLRFVPGVMRRMASDIASGARRRNPLFDPQTLAPIAGPHRLDAGERAELAQAMERAA